MNKFETAYKDFLLEYEEHEETPEETRFSIGGFIASLVGAGTSILAGLSGIYSPESLAWLTVTVLLILGGSLQILYPEFGKAIDVKTILGKLLRTKKMDRIIDISQSVIEQNENIDAAEVLKHKEAFENAIAAKDWSSLNTEIEKVKEYYKA